MNPWYVLITAGLLEACWAIGLKYTDGFTRIIPSIATASAITASMVLLAKASQSIPIGTAYGVWVGIGVIGAAVLGAFLFGETMSGPRIFFLLLLVGSIIGLKQTA